MTNQNSTEKQEVRLERHNSEQNVKHEVKALKLSPAPENEKLNEELLGKIPNKALGDILNKARQQGIEIGRKEIISEGVIEALFKTAFPREKFEKMMEDSRKAGKEAERKRIIDDIGHQRPHTPEEDDFFQRLLNHLKNSEANKG